MIVEIDLMPKDKISSVWHGDVLKWCEQSIEGSLNTIEYIKQMLDSDNMQLWLIQVEGQAKGVCITEINAWAKGNALTAVIVGGESVELWVSALGDTLDRFAKHQGCKAIYAYGRIGWKNILNTLGWVMDSVSYMKEIK